MQVLLYVPVGRWGACELLINNRYKCYNRALFLTGLSLTNRPFPDFLKPQCFANFIYSRGRKEV